jgi:hypothetical protein
MSPRDTRLNSITNAIRGLAQQVMQPAQDVSDAKEALDLQRDDVSSLRESLMIQVARLSHAEGWTKGEIDAAAKEAGKAQSNRPEGEKPSAGEKTMGVFISDLRQVANPKVCAHFTALVTFRDDAWNAEDMAYSAALGDDKKTVPRPCRKLWGRRYHMLMALVRDTIDEKGVFLSPGDVVRYAIENDPDLNPTKVKARLDLIVAKLTEIHADFQHDDIKVCIDYLGVLDVKDLIASKVARAVSTPVWTPADIPCVPTPGETAQPVQPPSEAKREGVPNEPAPAPVAPPRIAPIPTPSAAPAAARKQTSVAQSLDDIDQLMNDTGRRPAQIMQAAE